MAFVIVHMPVPDDIESYSFLPNVTGGTEYFKTFYEAFECLEIMGLEDEQDFKVLRVH
jgi:hypothetical protein